MSIWGCNPVRVREDLYKLLKSHQEENLKAAEFFSMVQVIWVGFKKKSALVLMEPIIFQGHIADLEHKFISNLPGTIFRKKVWKRLVSNQSLGIFTWKR